MRVFIAVDLPAEVRETLAGLIADLKKDLRGPRWARPEGIHLTLKFLGEVRETDLGRLRDGIASCVPGSVGPFDLSLEGLGRFPEKGRPRVLWAGLADPTGSLPRLQEAVERGVETAAIPGLRRENRPFRPHLTLARCGDGAPPAGLAAALDRGRGAVRGGFTVRSVCTFQSLLRPDGARYVKLEEVSL